MNKILSFTILILSLSKNSFGVKIGSDLVPSRERLITFTSSDKDNEILGFAAMQNGFVLQDAQTRVVYNSFFPVSGDVALNGGHLVLKQDLILRDSEKMYLGNILGN